MKTSLPERLSQSLSEPGDRLANVVDAGIAATQMVRTLLIGVPFLLGSLVNPYRRARSDAARRAF
jgi:hypothetical protein